MAVKAARRQPHQVVGGHAQLEAGQRSCVIDRLDSIESDDRPALLKTDRRQRQAFDAFSPLDEQLGTRIEPLLGKVRLEIDDHLATKSVWAGNLADNRHLIPRHG